jgi:hypothetical protein
VLIRAIGAPIGDCILRIIFKIFSKKKLKKNLLKFLKISLYYFIKVCVKSLPKTCHFQSFSNPFTSHFIV